MIRRQFLRPVAALLGALCLVSGCHSWKQEPVSAAAPNRRQMSSARVRLVDGRQLMIIEPRVVGDSLTGHFDSIGPGPASQPRTLTSVPVSIPAAQVISLETRHLNGWKTAGLVAGLYVVVVGLYAATCTPGWYCSR